MRKMEKVNTKIEMKRRELTVTSEKKEFFRQKTFLGIISIRRTRTSSKSPRVPNHQVAPNRNDFQNYSDWRETQKHEFGIGDQRRITSKTEQEKVIDPWKRLKNGNNFQKQRIGLKTMTRSSERSR
jgi:hypothetical protein